MPRVNLAVVLVKVFPESHNGKEQDKHFMYKMKWLIFAARRGRNAELCSSRCSVWAMKNALEATKAYASIVEARLALNRQHPDVRRRDWDKLKPETAARQILPAVGGSVLLSEHWSTVFPLSVDPRHGHQVAATPWYPKSSGGTPTCIPLSPTR